MTVYDFDGTLNAGVEPTMPYCVISGRTWDEYGDDITAYAELVPVYIRGSGEVTDIDHIANFKSAMINLLGIEKFYENNPTEADIIRSQTDCEVILVGGEED